MARSIERQRHILDYTLASILRRKGKNGALLTVYTLIIFILSSVLFFTHALRQEAQAVLKETPEIIVQRTLTGRFHTIPLSYADTIRGIRGVVSVEPRLWGYHYDSNTLANYTIVVPGQDAPPDGSIDIGSGISRVREAHERDIIGFSGFDGKPHGFKVRSVISAESQLVSADLILMSERDYRAFSGIPDNHAIDLVLKVRNSKEYTTIAEKIVRLLPDTRPIVRNEILRTYNAVFSWRSGLILVIFSAAALAFAIFAWDKASGLSAEERREIGILKAVGWETSDILFMKFWEGLAISLTAFLLGVSLAYLHVFFSQSFLFAPILKGWSTLYPVFKLVPTISFGQLTATFLLTVVPYVVTTILPSWRAATIDPDAVMR
jgi:cell division protein FtsX